jgi:trehalose 6-phosphate synthase
MPPSHLVSPRLLAADQLARDLARAPALTLLLDFDGTLVEFAATPEAVVLAPETASLLRELATVLPRVVIVSGRPHALLAPYAALVPELGWIAEHGAWHREATGEWIGPPLAAELEEIFAILAPFAPIPGVRIEPKSLACCLHWRLVPLALKRPMIAAAELAVDEWLESHPDYERIDGVEMLEVRRLTVNKGLAVEQVRAADPTARIIAIGDDDTDEDMFADLRTDELAIGVGDHRVRVACSLPGPRDVHAFLRWLLDVRRGASSPFLAEHGRVPPPASVQTRLLVVTNRTPPQLHGRHRPVGGLVSALAPALRSYDGIWLGWSGLESHGDRRVLLEPETVPLHASFDFPPAWRERFYAGFCNRALWPLFHGFPDRTRYRDDDWEAYVHANAEFAAHARTLVEPEGTVWVHDYHLLLVGRDLRAAGFLGAIGLFLHIPFPQRDAFATLPWGREIVDAMARFDLIGFHTEQWARNFQECARACGAVRLPEIGVFPIGVDPAVFASRSASGDREVAGLRAALGSRRLILGVDRLDYAKGIPERLLAFERLLETHPEWCGKVAFVQISVPSRTEVPEYADLRERVETLVGRINGRFGEADWVPVRYLYRSYDHAVLAELYRSADVALVTPLRDGLNLVAKEFVLAQAPARPGVLVLSQFAGAAVELSAAVITNPFHVDGLANDLDLALRMPADERMRRHAQLLASLEGRTPERWASAFLDRLARAKRSVA